MVSRSSLTCVLVALLGGCHIWYGERETIQLMVHSTSGKQVWCGVGMPGGTSEEADELQRERCVTVLKTAGFVCMGLPEHWEARACSGD